jgi:hypothetical protein
VCRALRRWQAGLGVALNASSAWSCTPPLPRLEDAPGAHRRSQRERQVTAGCWRV